MYEQYGADGIAAYKETIAYAKSKGLIVIGDIKRNDIASTAEAYSDGHIGEIDIDGEKDTIFRSDYITINPYLGADSVEPFLKNCRQYGKGLFVLVKTSNKGGGLFQDLETTDGLKVYEKVAVYVDDIGKDFIGSLFWRGRQYGAS
jgi:orotidine-5'-phosphate decarboxylase